MTNPTATRRCVTPRPGTVRWRLVALLTAACALSLATLPALASARTRHHRHHRNHAHKTHQVRRYEVRLHVHQVRVRRGRVHSATAHPPTCVGAHVRISRTSRRAVRRSVNCLINVQRRDHGLPGLRGNRRLDTSAQRWTDVMVDDRAFSHGADFASRISAVGFDWTRIGENIATGFRTPAGVVRAWMASTGHCQNILNPLFREDGTGVDLGEAMPHGRGTWTMDFGLLAHQRPGSADWTAAEGCPYIGA